MDYSTYTLDRVGISAIRKLLCTYFLLNTHKTIFEKNLKLSTWNFAHLDTFSIHHKKILTYVHTYVLLTFIPHVGICLRNWKPKNRYWVQYTEQTHISCSVGRNTGWYLTINYDPKKFALYVSSDPPFRRSKKMEAVSHHFSIADMRHSQAPIIHPARPECSD